MKMVLFLILLLATQAQACELLVRAKNNTNADPEEDRRGCYKRGMVVLIMPDGHQWGNGERLPGFVVIKIPEISVAKAQKYIAEQYQGVDADGVPIRYRRRLWQVRWDDLPAAAKTRLANDGELVIKATDAYSGSFDYTWTQVKSFFRNLETNLDETADL